MSLRVSSYPRTFWILLNCIVGVFAFSPTTANAAVFSADFGGVAGTFDAPVGGGLISSFSVTFGDTTFDTPDIGDMAPVYNPILNTLNGTMDVEFTGNANPTGAVFNSVASPTCPLGDCVLQLFDTQGGLIPPEFLAVNFITFQNLDFGFYSIDPLPAPIPLPAAFPLLFSALAGLGLLRRRQKSIVAARN